MQEHIVNKYLHKNQHSRRYCKVYHHTKPYYKQITCSTTRRHILNKELRKHIMHQYTKAHSKMRHNTKGYFEQVKSEI